jgi:hypothetical protein
MVEMKRLLLVPLFALVLTLASLLYAWNSYSWGFEVLNYGYPITWLASFTSPFGTHWQMNAVGLSFDYLFWFDASAAGIFSVILLKDKISLFRRQALP